MRLYEFTAQKDYTLPTDDAEDSIRQVERNGKADDTVPYPKKKAPARSLKLSDTLSNACSINHDIGGNHRSICHRTPQVPAA